MKASLPVIFVALCGILRSTDLFFRNPALATLPLIVLISWEHLVNLLVLTPTLPSVYKEIKKITPKDFLHLIIVGFGASAMGLICFSASFAYINPAITVIFQKLQPLITIALSVIFLKEKINKRFMLWTLFTVLCVILVSVDLRFPLQQDFHNLFKGIALAVLAATFWGSGTVFGKILLKKYSQRFVVLSRFALGALFGVSLSYIMGNGLEAERILGDKTLIMPIAYMALISGTLAVNFFYAGLQKIQASLIGVLELFFPVFSVLIMWFFFNKPLSITQIFFALMLFYGSYKATESINKKEENNL
jgi:DME family drug/metabolite transporter